MFKRAIELDPNFAYAHFQLGATYAKMKRLDDAKRQFEIGVGLLQTAYPKTLERTEAFIAYLGDNKEEVRRLLPRLEATLGDPLAATAMEIAGYYFYLGEVDVGFNWLEQSYSRRESQLSEISHDEIFDGIRNDPRFQSVLKRLGLEQPTNVLEFT